MTDDTLLDTVYVGSNGRFYARDERDRHLETGRWRRCLREVRSGRELVETCDGGLLHLEPVALSAVPEWIEARADPATGVRLVDTRRTLPPGVERGTGGAVRSRR